MTKATCPICGSATEYLFTQPFRRFAHLDIDQAPNIDIEYNKCPKCQLIFSPEMHTWTDQQFAELCYNDVYKLYDTDVAAEEGLRHRASFDIIRAHTTPCTHLDFGGGHGQLARLCKKHGFDSVCYDRFTENNNAEYLKGQYDLVTSIEVFEHLVDINGTMDLLTKCCGKSLYISTSFHDYTTDYHNWYYCNPRVGHINMFGRATIAYLFDKYGLSIQDTVMRFGDNANMWITKK